MCFALLEGYSREASWADKTIKAEERLRRFAHEHLSGMKIEERTLVCLSEATTTTTLMSTMRGLNTCIEERVTGQVTNQGV